MATPKFDFSAIESNIEAAGKYKADHKEVEAPVSRAGMRPLIFKQDPRYSAIKARIIDEFNEQKKVQKDLYDFCTERRGDGNYEAGMKEANGLINGISRNVGFTDSTLLILLDFLGLDLQFIRREETFSEAEATGITED